MTKRLHKPDYVFFGIASFLFLFGILMLASASTVIAYERFQNSSYYLTHQLLFGALPGVVLFLIMYSIDYHLWRRWVRFLFPLSLLLLILVFIPGVGVSYGRAQNWFSLGGFSFQPIELVKLTFVLYLALWLEERESLIQNTKGVFLPFLVLLGIVGGLIVLQPDLGGFLIVAMIALLMYFVAGAPWWQFGAIGSAGAALLAFVILAAPYRLSRLITFLNPDFDKLGVGYHVQQALLAVGSGGFFGLGLGQSRQKFLYLPEVIGDSIFAIIAEELGFIVTTLFVLLWIVLLVRGFHIAKNAPDTFGWYTSIGLTVWLVVQAFVNMGAMVRVFPLTGVTLPLVSYGGTSLVITLAAIGLLLNISRHTIVEKKK